jgi:hypothetical protein
VPRFLIAALRRQVGGRRPDQLVFITAAGTPLRNSSFRHHVFDPASSVPVCSPDPA